HVGSGRVVTASGVSATASNGATPVYGYRLASNTASGAVGTITPASLSLAAGTDSRLYDGTTASAVAPVVSGLVAGDNLTGLAQTFDSRNVGSRTLAVTGYTVNDGNGGANYTVTAQTAAGTITQAALTLAARTDSRAYNGTAASAAAPVVSGLAGGDSVSGLAQAFDSRNAGGRTLAVTGFMVNDGNGGANYTVSTRPTAGTISPASLTLAAAADSRVYDATTASAAAPTVLSGLVAGDSVNGLVQTFDSRNAGSRLLTVSGFSVSDGNAGANYIVATRAAAGRITPAPLVIAATPDDKVYDATTASAASPSIVSGLRGSDSVVGLTQSFDSRDAGPRTLGVTGYTVGDGNSGANYTVTANGATGTIRPAPLVVTAEDRSRQTGQPEPTFGATFRGLVGAETPSSFAGTLAFRTPATLASPAGSYAIVASGLSSTNYVIDYVDGILSVLAPSSSPATLAARMTTRDLGIDTPIVVRPRCPIDADSDLATPAAVGVAFEPRPGTLPWGSSTLTGGCADAKRH
ncbi:MAG: YDG domain-containing protein, partial [Caldimonas sp.]